MVRLVRDGEKRGGARGEVGKREEYKLYLSRHCHHPNDPTSKVST